MRRRQQREAISDELSVAIGLIWGHLNCYQYEQAYDLARGCLRVWTDEPRLMLMAAYAAVELLEPLDEKTLAVLHAAECKEWTHRVLCRSEANGDVGDLP
jgi:hypothetical protein